ncbi:MAG: hypothetical protein RLN76_11205 [Phycisphaeraceae bacterium]
MNKRSSKPMPWPVDEASQAEILDSFKRAYLKDLYNSKIPIAQRRDEARVNLLRMCSKYDYRGFIYSCILPPEITDNQDAIDASRLRRFFIQNPYVNELMPDLEAMVQHWRDVYLDDLSDSDIDSEIRVTVARERVEEDLDDYGYDEVLCEHIIESCDDEPTPELRDFLDQREWFENKLKKIRADTPVTSSIQIDEWPIDKDRQQSIILELRRFYFNAIEEHAAKYAEHAEEKARDLLEDRCSEIDCVPYLIDRVLGVDGAENKETDAVQVGETGSPEGAVGVLEGDRHSSSPNESDPEIKQQASLHRQLGEARDDLERARRSLVVAKKNRVVLSAWLAVMSASSLFWLTLLGDEAGVVGLVALFASMGGLATAAFHSTSS